MTDDLDIEGMDVALWQERLKIDIHELHTNVAEQPSYCEEIGRLSAKAKAAAKRMKLDLDLMEAKLESNIRNNPDAYGVAKVTENAIKAAIIQNEEISRAKRALIDDEQCSDEFQVLVNAFEHRRSMLNNEVQLWSTNYWGEKSGKVSGDTKGTLVEKQEDDREKFREGAREQRRKKQEERDE